MFAPLQELLGQVTLPDDCVLDERTLCDLELLLTGALAPLRGFMGLEDYQSCLHNMRLRNGTVWTIPIVLPIPRSSISQGQPITGASGSNSTSPVKNTGSPTSGASAAGSSAVVEGGRCLKIRDATNALIAELEVTSVFIPDIEELKVCMFGEDNENHPYSKLLDQYHSDVCYVGGPILPRHPIIHFDYRQYRLLPGQVRERIRERKWKNIIGFQTRNPMHRSHFELTRQAIREVEEATGESANLMISPTVGPTQPGDIDFRTRARCYEKILVHYSIEPLLVFLPIAMRMAGPREAVWHAIIRKNYGCTHFIVGRDHAGPSIRRKKSGLPYFQPYDAHELITRFSTELGITPVLGKNMLYCGSRLGFVREDKIPASLQAEGEMMEEGVKSISGTRFREMLMNDEEIPEWYCFKDISDELKRSVRPRYNLGLCVYFTGLPCSGKSTLASALEALLLERYEENRKVTILDADVIRRHLSYGLGYTKLDRSMNVRRIGYVASEIVKHNGICIVANIAPYEEDREWNKKLIESTGGNYVEIYLSTPLEICEKRDIKELYKKARQGFIKQFTGISDPYEIPKNPNLVIDSSNDAFGCINLIMQYLEQNQYVQKHY